MFNFMLQDNPRVGKGSSTFGQLATWGAERCYVMEQKLCELENGGFKTMDEFKPYMKALNGIDNHSPVGRQYFDKVTTVFLERFRLTFEKHVALQWRSPETLHYMLGGNPHLAQALCRWLVDDGQDEYSFPDQEVTLDSHHKMTHGDVVVNLQECMKYLTDKADCHDVRAGRFVKHNWAHIIYLANMDAPVDLLGEQVPAELLPLSEAIWSQIVIHSIHQQRCENYVQLTGLLSITGVGEGRRSARAIIVGAIIRRFNSWGLRERNTELHAKGKQPVKRLQEGHKVRLFLRYLDEFFKHVDAAKTELGVGIHQTLYNQVVGTSKKASEFEREKALAKFETDLAQARTISAAELPAGVDRTARVGGGIVLGILTGTNGCIPHVHAKIRARSIPMSELEEESWTLAEKRGKIKQHEYNDRVSKDAAFCRETKVNDITYIVPWSGELKDTAVFAKQQEILDKRNGIVPLLGNITGS